MIAMAVRQIRLCMLLNICTFLYTGRAEKAAVFSSRDLFQATNITSLGDALAIDPRFSILSEYGWPNLPERSCLLTAVHAMADLAMERFDRLIAPVSPEPNMKHIVENNEGRIVS